MDMNDALWDDGEWVSWDDIDQQIQYHEWRARYPNADISLVPIFEQLISVAEHYHNATGRHLQVYGDIGELYGAITYGIKLHRNYAQGSDGRLGNDYVEIKTITPFSRSDRVSISLAGHFSKLFLVKITETFEISGRLIKRADLPKPKGKNVVLRWHDVVGVQR